MKRYVCNHCSERFTFPKKPSYCPFCGSEDTVDADMQRSRNTAMQMIAEYNDIIIKLQAFAEEYIKYSTRAKEIRKTLASYKCRGIITDADLPYNKYEPLLTQVKIPKL